MNYGEAFRYLDSFANYEKTGYVDAKVFNLDRMRHLSGIFGNPEESFLSIHVAGTKGKGSTACFIAAILKEAGFRVGLYTSPHLVDIRERVRINGEMITESDLARHADIIRTRLELQPTFFEIYTLLAFNYFKEKKIDYAVIEAGLGGRLDATNIVRPLISVISPVSYDHQEILGNDLEKIALEKSGIVKTGCDAVSAPQEGPALGVIQRACSASGARLVLVGKDIGFREVYHDSEKEIFDIRGRFGDYRNCRSRLLGRHQIVNAVSAVGAIEALKKRGARISGEDIKRGIEKTENPARCEIMAKNPYIILDGAQNKASAKALKEAIKRNFNYERLILVLGLSKEKDIKGICEELTHFADYIILTKAKVERGAEPGVIAGFIKGKGAILTTSVEEAMEKGLAMTGERDMLLVTGSFFVIGEIKAHAEKISP